MNFDPPVLYVPADATMSPELTAFLKTATRVRYTFSTTADGLRATVPITHSPRRVLIVGDSVAFGLGVDDDATMASQLQRAAAGRFEVVNAAVAGYGREQVLLVAQRQLAARPAEALIYVANTTDFEGDSAPELLRSAGEMIERLAALKGGAARRIVVMLTGYLEYAVRDVVNARIHGWHGQWVHTDDLRRELPRLTRQFGLEFIDANGLVDATVQAEGTIFSPFAMFVDHAHLSRNGHRLAAAAVLETLENGGR